MLHVLEMRPVAFNDNHQHARLRSDRMPDPTRDIVYDTLLHVRALEMNLFSERRLNQSRMPSGQHKNLIGFRMALNLRKVVSMKILAII